MMVYNLFNNRVFVVHGHDEEAKNAVVEFLKELKLEPVILHEQESRGRSIAEKLEKNSNVQAAIVLLTADDKGRKRRIRKSNDRARQNVILELGYFWGKLGRERVIALYIKGVELPSDYKGIAYIEYDPSGIWKDQVIKELESIITII